MAGAWTTLSVKDATGTTRTMRAWDESGTGTGPYSFGQVLADGNGVALAKAEDAASANGDFGLVGMAIQKASPADTAGTDGDYAPLQISGGRLWVNASAIAHDAADSGNPVKVGGRARSSEIAAVSNNDRSDLITDLVGKLIVLLIIQDW